jgi:hypothetical protein
MLQQLKNIYGDLSVKIAAFLVIPLSLLAFCAPAQAEKTCGFYNGGTLVLPVDNIYSSLYDDSEKSRKLLERDCKMYSGFVSDRTKLPLSSCPSFGSTTVVGKYAWQGKLYPVGYEKTIVLKRATTANQLKCSPGKAGRCSWYNVSVETSPASCVFE